jgi:hypothetical protein
MSSRISAARRSSFALATLAVLLLAGLARATTFDAVRPTIYRDPVGDQTLPRGDITRIAVSENRGIITLTLDIPGLRRIAILNIDVDRNRHIDYSLDLRRSMSSKADIAIWRWAADDTLTDAAAKFLSASRHGERYTYRFRSSALGIQRAFGFQAHILGPALGEVTDWAPDDPQGWFTHRLTRG